MRYLEKLRHEIESKKNSFYLAKNLSRSQEIIQILRNNTSSLDTSLTFLEEENVFEVASTCVKKNGVYPISFTYPKWASYKEVGNIERELSSIIPGKPYEYSEERLYMKQYQTSRWSITHRKGGWDCMRHLEILFSGSLPLMTDISKVPKFTMTFYPKNNMQLLYKSFITNQTYPNEIFCNSLREYIEKFLTPEFVANYILTISKKDNPNLSGIKRVILVTEDIQLQPDYMTVTIIAGFKKILKDVIVLPNEPHYIYSDADYSMDHLYGRGSSYGRVLEPHLRRNTDIFKKPTDRDLIIVIGSNFRGVVSQGMRYGISSSDIIGIFGGDKPLSGCQLKMAKKVFSRVFVREIA